MTGDRRRPPWWPENEPWPPRGRPPFVAPLLRRMAIGAAIFIGVVVLLAIVSGAIWGHERRGGDGPPFRPFVLLVIVVVLFIVGGRFARRFTRPLGNVLETIDRLAGGDYAARATPSGPPELLALGDAVNSMAARLAAGEEQRRALVADIAHEVRTPLAIIRGNIEGILDGLYPADEARLAPVLEEVEIIARLTDDLQTLSSAEAGMLRLHPEPVDLPALITEIVALFEPEAARHGVSLAAETVPVPPLDLDPGRVRQVFENLLTNALRHTPEGGRVTATARPLPAGVRVDIADTGSGIAPDDLPHVFERYRKAADSSGSGLGLAIARRLVEAHGGTIAAASTPGAGATITVTFPTPR